MMHIVEAGERNDLPYCERWKITDQNFGLGAKIGAISFDRGRLEYNGWRVVWTMLSRTFVFQNTFNPAAFGFEDQRLLVKLPFSREMWNAALLAADNPDRSRALHRFLQFLLLLI